MKTAINISRVEALDIKQAKDYVAFICIHDEHEKEIPLNIETGNPILYLTFADLRGGYAVKHHRTEKFYHPVTREQIYQLLDFIEEHKDKSFVVNCSMGVSRSSAISYFIHLYYQHRLREHFWLVSSPNEYLFGYLMLEKGRKDYENLQNGK